MITRKSILETFPSSLHSQREHMLREYLQYQMLEAIFTSKFAEKLCFIGGTVLRLGYNNQRFSEDLDFDNVDLSYEEFQELLDIISTSLSLKNIVVEWKFTKKGAFHGYFKFPHLLYDLGITGMKTQKLLIQVDTTSQGYDFTYEKKLIEKYSTMSLWNIAPLSLLLSHKIYTAFERKRTKGRDFFDLLFILSKTKTPDYGFLQEKLGISSGKEVKEHILTTSKELDFKYLQSDVQPFLFNPNDQSVLLFPEIIEQIEFGDSV